MASTKNSPAVKTVTDVATQDEMIGRFLAAAESMKAVNDPEAIMAQAIARMAQAETVDDLLAEDASQAIGLKDDIRDGETFTINRAEIQESTIAGATLPVYVVMHTDRGVITSGATYVVLACVRLQQMDAYPVTVKKATKDLGEGKTLITLVRG